MALVLGLDIGTHSLTGAVFAGAAKKFRLVDFFREEIPSMESSLRAAADPGQEGAGAPQGPQAGGEYVPPASIEELIQKVLEKHNLKGVDVVASVDAKDCIVREGPVPFTREDQIEKVIPYQAEELLPTLQVEDLVLEWIKVGEANGKSTVALFALRNEVVQARLDTLKRADVDPMALDLDAAALFNAFAATPLYDPKKSTLLIDMGATSTKIVLVEGGQLKKVRAFRAGARALSPDRLIEQPAVAGAAVGATGGDPASADAFGGYSIEARFQEIENALRRLEPVTSTDPVSAADIDPSMPIAILSDEDFERVQDDLERETAAASAKAAAAHKAFGAEGNGRGESQYRDYLERVGREIQRTLATSKAGVELICLTGGMSGREETCRFFQEELDVETIQFDFGDSFASDAEGLRTEDLSRFGAVAVGLALKEFGHDLTGLDFRKGRFRFEHRFSRLRFPLLVAASLAFVFFLQTAFWAYHEHERLAVKGASFQGAMEDAYKEFFGKPVAEGRDPLAAAREQRDLWKGKGVGDVGRVVPFVDAIYNFGEVMNSSNLQYTLKSLSFDFKVKSGTGPTGKRAGLVGTASTVELITSDNSAHLNLEKKFNKDPKSTFYDAKGSSTATPQKGEYTVSLSLTPKSTALRQLE
jgi:Tfp pilus assembly PilM family ATPase